MTKLPKLIKTIVASNSPLPLKTITGENFNQRINRKKPGAAELQPKTRNISRKGAKAAKEKINPNLAFLASWRENNPRRPSLKGKTAGKICASCESL